MDKNRKNDKKRALNEAQIFEENIKTLRNLMLNRLDENAFSSVVGVDVLSLQYRKAVVALKVDARHLNPNGTAHGGVLMTLADNAAGGAVLYTGQKIPTLDLHYRFLKPVFDGDYVAATAKVVQAGGHIVVIEVKVEREHELVGTATASFYKVDSYHEEISPDVFDRIEPYIREYISQKTKKA